MSTVDLYYFDHFSFDVIVCITYTGVGVNQTLGEHL